MYWCDAWPWFLNAQDLTESIALLRVIKGEVEIAVCLCVVSKGGLVEGGVQSLSTC